MDKKTGIFISILAVISVVGYLIYRGSKPSSQTTTTSTVSNGGLANSLGGIVSGLSGLFGGNTHNTNCSIGVPSSSDPCIDQCGFPISSDVNPACV